MSPVEIDVFNGDADGLFAATSCDSPSQPGPGAVRVVTGLKREIALLERIDRAGRRCAGDARVRHRARPQPRRARPPARRRATVRWFDHHHPGAVPEHPRLRTFIDTSPAPAAA